MSDTADTTAADTPAAAPLLRIVRGNPSDEEVAVLTSLVAAAAGSSNSGPVETGPRDDWGRPEDRLRPVWGAPTSFTNLRA
ncbi:acyl-CoA carboxylase subunit epsilon [Gordonia hankookensis]|uniref:Acyl-CoA carboxylase subunit epsilon n=1 Tax=Gordonia hankookensis TaxID=589403 RepID=A0ABR7WDN4_9ACTN|nr:acyl-CoA carboxylase subunit epsilon [Gordonia hankookensis]MBD1320888.1 acyl-CoA carboxylase subunit epsilon [Gordonia hankookensis]